jgi:peptidoglycan hydrolase-like protein with peptidoglycan-binding domain
MPRGRIRWGAALTVAVAMLLAASPALAGSPKVAALQAALKAMGTYPAEVDGVPGPITRTATIRFQRRRHLTVDGVAGPQTRRALGRRGRPRLGSRVLTQPRVGWDVAALQFLLWRRGLSPGAIDGAFGPGTGRAVLAFQRSAGITADGLAGPQTIRALRHGTTTHPDSPVRFYRPVAGPIGDGFGHVGGRRHTGIDFPVPRGTPIKAAGRGVVAFAGWNTGGYGNLVVVNHRLGFSTWYAHMSRIASVPGQAVSGGTLLGYVGATGHATGPHVHFEVRRFDTPIDPMPYLLAGTAARASGTLPHALECGPASGGRDEAVPARGPSRFARARIPGC